MVDLLNEENWIRWMDRLSEDNYLVIDEFITEEELHDFRAFFHQQLEQEEFSKAGIGTLGQYQVKSEIRGDYIRWLDPDRDEKVRPFFDRINEVIRQLNRYCYLGLSGAEFHLAHYPPGTFYKRHLDQFQQRSNRLISVILYLNENWQPGDGGELRMFLDGKEDTIAPIARRVAIMRSDQVEHEVLMTHKDRYSITGWLLRQPLGLSFLS